MTIACFVNRAQQHIKTFALLALASILGVTNASAASCNSGWLYGGDRMSNSLVDCLAQDRQGFIWIGTRYGLNCFDGYNFLIYTSHSDDEHSLANNAISALLLDTHDRMWVGTPKGLHLFRPATNDFLRVILPIENPEDQPRVTSITKDKEGNIYVSTAGYGLFEIKNGECEAHPYTNPYSTPDTFWGRIFIDESDRLWMPNQKHEITVLDHANGDTLMFKHQSPYSLLCRIVDDKKGGAYVLSQYGIEHFNGKEFEPVPGEQIGATDGILNEEGRLVIGTNGKGLYAIDEEGTLRPLGIGTRDLDLSLARITSLMRDRDNNMWVGCAEAGLFFSPADCPEFATVPLTRHGFSSTSVPTGVATDTLGNVYLAVPGQGLLKKTPDQPLMVQVPGIKDATYVYRDQQGRNWFAIGKTLYSLNPVNNSFKVVDTYPDCIDLRSLTSDSSGKLYISVFGQGLLIYDPATGKSQRFSMFDQPDANGTKLNNNWILTVLCDSRDLVWLGTSAGVSCYDTKAQAFKTFNGKDAILKEHPILALAEDSERRIVVGSPDGLYMCTAAGETDIYPHSEPLRDLQINSIIALPNGKLWCSTTKGIWDYSPADSTFTGHINGNGLRGHEYVENVGAYADNGNIIFGTPDGLVWFNPEEVVSDNKTPAKPFVSAIYLGDELVTSTTKSGNKLVVESQINEIEKIRIDHSENMISLEFTSFDYGNAPNLLLEYRIGRGGWITLPEGENAITLSHIHYGDYPMEIRFRNHNMASESKMIMLHVTPPWYATIWARIIYLVLIILALTGAFLIWRRRQMRIDDEQKMQFLINATHDIRTPLTLILNPLRQLMHRTDTRLANPDACPSDDESVKNDRRLLDIIDHNANRVLTLVNQILDIRKMDKQGMALRCQKVSLIQLIESASKVFEYDARSRNMTFTFHQDYDVKVWVDKKQFDKVISNLLSNAFKFTPDGGEVTITLATEGNKAIIEVTDSGKGLSQGEEDRIFKRFYQGAAQTTVNTESTGIGLNLCRMIMEMHHGTISGHNRTDGVQGSVFRVELPLGKDHLHAEQIIDMPEEAPKAPAPAPAANQANKPKVLLVDDDPEITEYIANELDDRYNFEIAMNGKQAIGELLTNAYDLVVTDIMMPEMSGFTLLRLIKSNASICHIPVVLLTTESAVANRLEGLEKGADAFLAKPFFVDELKATIDNLINNRVRLKNKFGVIEKATEMVEKQEFEDSDKKLMERIMKCINKNISDPEFDVDMMCEEVGISRTHLYRKMKDMTGLSAADFIRNIRLEEAARLLKENHANVSQVAYSLGFANPTHFSRVFKKHFCFTPTEYAKMGSNENK